MTDCQVSAHRPPPRVAYITVKDQTPFQAAAVTGDEGYSRRWHTPRQPCSTAYSQAGPKAPTLSDPISKSKLKPISLYNKLKIRRAFNRSLILALSLHA